MKKAKKSKKAVKKEDKTKYDKFKVKKAKSKAKAKANAKTLKQVKKMLMNLELENMAGLVYKWVYLETVLQF